MPSVSASTKLALIDEFDTVLGLDLTKAAKKQLDKVEEEKSTVSDDPFIREIEEMIQKRIDAKKAKDYANLLYNQALLMAQLPIEDPVAYTKLVCSLMK